MRVVVWLGAMVAASALVIATSSRSEPEPWTLPPRLPPETPWLTPEAAAQILGPHGGLGPLFEGVEIGGPAPPPTVRARIAEFARANNVDLDLDIVAGAVAAVQFEVMFGGCCGYEGADVLALRIRRPRTEPCCACDREWFDDWAFATEAGVYTRARVRVNRVRVRWEREMTLLELLERADRLLGRDVRVVAREARDRWIPIEWGRRYVLEIPYAVDRFQMQVPETPGIQIVAARGRIAELSFSIRNDGESGTAKVLRSRWGRPRVVHDHAWTWRKRDRIISAEFEYTTSTRITVRRR